MAPSFSVFSALAILACANSAKVRECPVETNIMTRDAGDAMGLTFANQLGIDVNVFWLNNEGSEMPAGTIGSFSDLNLNSFAGHAFRFRTASGGLLLEYVARKNRAYASTTHVAITPCGDMDNNFPLWDEGRDEEFAALLHDHSRPCLPANDSKYWSCMKYYTREDVLARDKSLYGFQPGETGERRTYQTFDSSYTAQIAKVPKVTPTGAGYQKMSMTKKLKDLLLEWYKLRREDSMVDHGTIAGGYTNNDVVKIDKVDLDKFRKVHGGIVKEMQQILQWWTKMRLRHTSTFGVRVYRRDSMLINHVDRMDTHLASAVLQVDQQVDENGGWPLEVLLPDGKVGEVYLQPGELVLYEGAWLRHGRPMRLRGKEFANIFTHFAPLDWRGPNEPDAPTYYGYVRGRCDTIADDNGVSRCKVGSGKEKDLEIELDLGNAFKKEIHTEL